MIGLDTNVLVRYLTQDDKAQSLAATRLIENGNTFFINTIVLCELAWVLESCYDLKKDDLANILKKILSTRQFTIENSKIAWHAIDDFGASKADFSDCLLGQINLHKDCEHTFTFDKALKGVAAFKHLA